MVALVLSVAVVLILNAFFRFEQRPEISPVARGKSLAQSQGCYACHGTHEGDARFNLRQNTAGIWRPKSIPTFWDNGIDKVDVLVDWITHGVPADEAESHQRLFIQMPSYEAFMSPEDIEAVAAWILSEGIRLSHTAEESNVSADAARVAELAPEKLFALGDRLSRQYGCYQCHGELGQGGVANPSSFKNYIPGFFGRDFLKLTANGDREEIAHWIDHGRGRAIESGVLGGFAKRYLDTQAIGMPAYRDRLTAEEKIILVEFLLLLNKDGPLSAKKIEQLLQRLNDESSL